MNENTLNANICDGLSVLWRTWWAAPYPDVVAGFSTSRVSAGRRTERGQWSLQPRQCFKEDLAHLITFSNVSNVGTMIITFT